MNLPEAVEALRSRVRTTVLLITLGLTTLACALPSLSKNAPTEVPILLAEAIEEQSPGLVEADEQVDIQQIESEQDGPHAAPFYLSEYGTFDFDNGSGINATAMIFGQPDPALADILFRNDRIEPQEGARLALWEGDTPGFDDCQSAALTGDELPTPNLQIDMTLCFQTDQGRYGFFTVDDLFLDSYGDVVMGFSYTLWGDDGVEMPPFRALHSILGVMYPRGASGKDLDFYRNHQVADLSFQRGSESVFEIHPVGGAEIAFWGDKIPSYEDCAGLTLTKEREIVALEIAPGLSPVKEPAFFCFRTNEGRLGRLYPKMVYFDASMSPLPYGDAMASRDFLTAYTLIEGEGNPDILVEYGADTWVLKKEASSALLPHRRTGEGISGRAILPIMDSFDFDTGSSLADFRSLYDVAYHGDDERQKAAMHPEHDDVLLAVWGESQPTYEDCSSAVLSNVPVVLEEGQYVCFKSSTGRFGFYRVNSFYFDYETVLDNSLPMFADFSYSTWALKGDKHLVHPSWLALDDGGDWLYPEQYDLDMALGSLNFDISFEAKTPGEVQLLPAEKARLNYWGISKPERGNCALLPLGQETLTVNVFPVQDDAVPGFNKLVAPEYFCYQTDEGRYGVLEFSGTYFNEEANILFLIISAETWFDEGIDFEEIAAARDFEMNPQDASPSEDVQPEVVGGVIASGEVRLPNVVSYDFFDEQMFEDFSAGDVGLEFNPDSLEGCFLSISREGGILGVITGDLADIGKVEPDFLSNGCLPVQVNTVYLMQRWQAPGMVVFFRVTAFDADGVTLEYIIK